MILTINEKRINFFPWIPCTTNVSRNNNIPGLIKIMPHRQQTWPVAQNWSRKPRWHIRTWSWLYRWGLVGQESMQDNKMTLQIGGRIQVRVSEMQAIITPFLATMQCHGNWHQHLSRPATTDSPTAGYHCSRWGRRNPEKDSTEQQFLGLGYWGIDLQNTASTLRI